MAKAGSGIGAALNGGNPRTQERDPNDNYNTPPDLTRALLRAWSPGGKVVWEPACGTGMMAEELIRAGYEVISSDLIDHGYGTPSIDFLRTTRRAADALITNPPFALASQFIEHAFALGIHDMALVFNATFWHPESHQAIWNKHTPAMVMPLTWRPDFKGLGAPTMNIIVAVWGGYVLGNDRPSALYRPLDRTPEDIADIKAASREKRAAGAAAKRASKTRLTIV